MASCTHIESLLQAFLDGELNAAERTIVEQHLSECRACHALLLRHRACVALIFETLASHRLKHDLSPGVLAHLPEMDHAYRVSHEVTLRAKQPPSRARWVRFLRPALAPILLVLLGVVLVISWPGADLPIPGIGMVTHQTGTVLGSSSENTARNNIPLHFVIHSEDRFETADHASLMVSLAGPSQIKVDENTRLLVHNAREIALEAGRIWLQVSKGEQLFRVLTPAGEATVYGTVFSVWIEGDRTFVLVESGKVQVQNPAGFTVLQSGEQAHMTPSERPVKDTVGNLDALTSWAGLITPDPEAEQHFLRAIRVPGVTRMHAEQVFVVDTDHRPVRSIIFEWKPAAPTEGRCGYNVYVSNDQMDALFHGYIEARVFLDPARNTYEFPVPEGLKLEQTGVLHISVVPDTRTGLVETAFTEVAAMGK